MDLLLVKTSDGNLIPAYDSDHDKLKKIGQGEIIKCKITKDRSGGLHRKYFSLIRMIFQNSERFQSETSLRYYLQIKAGFFEMIEGDQEAVIVPISIRYDSMDQAEFSELYDKVLKVCAEEFFDENNETILQNIEQFY